MKNVYFQLNDCIPPISKLFSQKSGKFKEQQQATQTISASQVMVALPAVWKKSSGLLHWLLYPGCCGECLAKAFSEIQAKKRNSRILREKKAFSRIVIEFYQNSSSSTKKKKKRPLALS